MSEIFVSRLKDEENIAILDDISDDEEDNEEIFILTEEMDKIIFEIFLATITICIKDEMLPLDPGKFFKDYMKIVAEKMNISFNLKHSSHKSINKLLRFIAKTYKIITFGKVCNSQKTDFILSVMWNND